MVWLSVFFSTTDCHRDGLERVEVADNATVRSLKEQIASSFNIPVECITLSQDPKLVISQLPRTGVMDLGSLLASAVITCMCCSQ